MDKLVHTLTCLASACKIITNNTKIKSYIKYVPNTVVWGFSDSVDITSGFMSTVASEKPLDAVTGIPAKMLSATVVQV